MDVLLLGPASTFLEPYIVATGDTFVRVDEKITVDGILSSEPDLIVSYGYRYILGPEILSICRAVNLHVSYLPWNRGADPNLWSLLEMTPRGVTIHCMDCGLDTGDIIVQQVADPITGNSTLRTTYAALTHQIVSLFAEFWPAIKQGDFSAMPQATGAGSYHKSSDKTVYEHLLRLGWDTPVSEIEGMACNCESESTGTSSND